MPDDPTGDVDAGQNLPDGAPVPEGPDFVPDLPAGDDPAWQAELDGGDA